MKDLHYFSAKLSLVRKIFLSIICFVFYASVAEAKLTDTYGPEIGLNLNNFFFSPVGTTATYTKAGFKAGIVVNRTINENLSIQPGLFLSQLGAKMDVNVVFVGPVRVPINIYYAQVPINLMYSLKLGPGQLFAGAGPYLAYALGISSSASDTSFKTDNLKIGSGPNAFIKALDIGASINAGYEMPQGIFARLSYGIGITNIAAQSSNTIRNASFSISVGWMFKANNKGKRE
jgi:hypothetical protein